MAENEEIMGQNVDVMEALQKMAAFMTQQFAGNQQTLNLMQQQMTVITQGFQAQSQKTEEANKQVVELTKQVGELTEKVEETKRQSAEATQAAEKAAQQAAVLTEKVVNLQEAQEKSNKQIIELTEENKKIKEDYKEIKEENKKIKEENKEVKEDLQEVKEENKKIKEENKETKEDLQEVKEDYDALNKSDPNISKNTIQNKYNEELRKLGIKKNKVVEIYKVDSIKKKFYKSPDKKIRIKKEMFDCLKAGRPYYSEELDSFITPVLNNEKKLIGIVSTQADNERERDAFIKVVGEKYDKVQSVLKKAIEEEGHVELIERATTDKLTQIYNLAGCEVECQVRTVAAMQQGLPCSLLMIDGDKFKDINDQYSHDAGNKVLQTIANTMKQYTSEENDIVVRYGGDEFFVVLNDCTGLEAYDVGEAIRRAIEALDIVLDDGRIINTTISMGVSEVKYPDNVDDGNVMNIISEYQKIADERLKAAKEGGGLDENGRPKERNVVSVTPEIAEQVRQRLAMQVEQKDKDHTPQRAEKDVSSYNARMARVTARSSISNEDVDVFVKTFLKTYNIALSEINDKEYTVTLPNEPARTLRYADGGKALVECLIDSKIGKNVYRAYSEKLDKQFDTQGKTASDKITEIFSQPIHMVAEKDCKWEILYTMLVTEKETKENVLSNYVSPEDIIHGDKQKGDNEHEL